MTGIATDHAPSSFLGENSELRLFLHNSPRKGRGDNDVH
jgi:hypothetical protein